MATETWVLNNSISLRDFGYNKTYTINFTSNSTEYKAMWTSRDSETQDITLHYTRKSDNYYQSVYVSLGTPGSPSGWINGEAYRTITFATAPTGTLLTWLQANGTKQETPKVTVDLTSLSGYESLAAGTYALSVRAKAAGYQDSDLSSTVSFTKLAAPVATASDTTVTWDGITNADSYDVYVDGELYENTTGGVTEYTATVKINGSCDADNCPIKLYDGIDANGTLLTTINENPSVGEVGTFSIKSGSLYIQASKYSGVVGAWYQVNVNNETGDAIASTTETEVVPISSNVIITFTDQYCLTGDTLITLADGSSKRIDQLTLDDKVLSYNPETLLLEPDEITYTDSTEHKMHTEYKIYTFADGTIVKTVHRHRFYNVERQAMVYMDEWKLGEHAINIHGEIVALANEITCKTEVRHYTIFTKNQNYFANGLLSGNRYTKSLSL